MLLGYCQSMVTAVTHFISNNKPYKHHTDNLLGVSIVQTCDSDKIALLSQVNVQAYSVYSVGIVVIKHVAIGISI